MSRAAAEIEPVSRMLSSSLRLAGADPCAGLENDADPYPRHAGTVPCAMRVFERPPNCFVLYEAVSLHNGHYTALTAHRRPRRNTIYRNQVTAYLTCCRGWLYLIAVLFLCPGGAGWLAIRRGLRGPDRRPPPDER